MVEPKLFAQSITSATAYRFVWTDGNWAIFTVNDATMEFSITSSWGAFGYRWDATPSVTRMLAERHDGGWDYVLGKFACMTHSETLKDAIDREATLAFFESCIRERHGHGDEADSLMADLEEWAGDECYGFQIPLCPTSIASEFPEYWREIRMCKPGTYQALRDRVLPFFGKWLRENVVPQLDATAAGRA